MMSSYTPNIDLLLSKEQIYKLSLSTYVDEIYYLDQTAKLVNSSENEDDSDMPNITDYDTTYFDVTGLSTGRDSYGLTGNGMKVGMIEGENLPLLYFFENSNITNVHGIADPGKFHGSKVALIMVGNNEYYTGAIPDAELYCSAIGGIEAREIVIKELLDYGVTAINMSCSIPDSDYGYNTYGTLSKYIDYISSNYNVTFIMSSGNKQINGIVASNMSYNSIIVGNCNNYGNLEADSSYNLLDDKAYKPDLVAPGVNITNPAGTMTGTSASAPLVTSAVIQLT